MVIRECTEHILRSFRLRVEVGYIGGILRMGRRCNAKTMHMCSMNNPADELKMQCKRYAGVSLMLISHAPA